MAARTCRVCLAETPAAAARFCAYCGAQFLDPSIDAAATVRDDDDYSVLFPPPPARAPAPAPAQALAPAVPYAIPITNSTAASGAYAVASATPTPAAMSEVEATKAALYPPVHAPTYHAPYEPATRAPPAAAAPSGSFRGKGDGEPPALFGEPPARRSDAHRGSSSSDEGAATKGGFLKSRYADHPNCDICRAGFDIGKRRHQCRKCGRFVCGACSPVRLLIPFGEQIEGARGYDVSLPQRACLHCAPSLHPLQEQLAALHARANAANAHEPRGRLHLPFASSLEQECRHAADIVGNFFRDDNAAASDRSIPVALLEKAQGLALLTIAHAGFVISGKVGTGLVVARLPDGSWSAPSAIGTAGLAGGFQLGGELVEVMIILGSRGAVEVFHKPQVNLGAGLDIAVGPYGRSAAAAAALSADALTANYSYSQSKGLFAGVSLSGSVIAARGDLNRKFYGRELEPRELLSGAVAPPAAAQPLYDAIAAAMRGVQEHRAVLEERSAMMGSCRRCQCAKYVAHTHQVWNKKCKSCDHVH